MLVAATPDGLANVYVLPARGGEMRTLMPPGENPRWRADESPDGRYTAYDEVSRATKYDIWILDLESGTTFPFQRSTADELRPSFSPNSGWIAYESDASGTSEIYVGAPSQPGRHRVSVDGGTRPFWSRDGRELFYSGRGHLMAVPVTTGERFTSRDPQELFPLTDLVVSDAHPDGERFLAVRVPQRPPVRGIQVIQNWTLDLEEVR